jgi:hypothetical protein
MATHNYGFDLKLVGAIHIRAGSADVARRKLMKLLDCADVAVCRRPGAAPIELEVSLHAETDATIHEVDDVECTEECPRCHGPSPDGGDGYDGYCADCADVLERRGAWD